VNRPGWCSAPLFEVGNTIALFPHPDGVARQLQGDNP